MKTPEELAEEFWNEWADKKFKGSSHEEVVTKAALWLIRQRDAEVLRAIEKMTTVDGIIFSAELKQKLGLEK